jgi:hypothetical protein
MLKYVHNIYKIMVKILLEKLRIGIHILSLKNLVFGYKIVCFPITVIKKKKQYSIVNLNEINNLLHKYICMAVY